MKKYLTCLLAATALAATETIIVYSNGHDGPPGIPPPGDTVNNG